MQEGTWWFIPRIVSRLLYIAGHKWEWVHPLITAVIPYLLSRMNHQVCLQFMAIFTGKRQRMDLGVVSFQTRMRCWGRLNSGWADKNLFEVPNDVSDFNENWKCMVLIHLGAKMEHTLWSYPSEKSSSKSQSLHVQVSWKLVFPHLPGEGC